MGRAAKLTGYSEGDTMMLDAVILHLRAGFWAASTGRAGRGAGAPDSTLS